MFIAALFTVAKIRKQPKCPSTEQNRYIKMWCIYTMLFIAKQLDLQIIKVREISQKEEKKYNMIHLYVEYNEKIKYNIFMKKKK